VPTFECVPVDVIFATVILGVPTKLDAAKAFPVHVAATVAVAAFPVQAAAVVAVAELPEHPVEVPVSVPMSVVAVTDVALTVLTVILGLSASPVAVPVRAPVKVVAVILELATMLLNVMFDEKAVPEELPIDPAPTAVPPIVTRGVMNVCAVKLLNARFELIVSVPWTVRFEENALDV